MQYRRVMAVGRDDQGSISRLCNFSTPWVLVTSVQAIRDIEAGHCQYYIQDDHGLSNLIVVRNEQGCRLQTDPAGESRNTLANLLKC
ncbi:hypothetical protein [Kushneria phosphatilytica]|uniref:Uncharacterized protein n=1 Tax=Kushneria phosphatilytica TaxID=657387 RepID=A0A1S1NZD2_9GAMM|nr:hypothetical protein [Kushneria phosphatilytica]OHV13876.1 hypothetical protein BH688_00555 [Kushneria phosphatilytica]QEL10430.1 hypothetical protein FY550_04295 [Kushneria phosphatilytica]